MDTGETWSIADVGGQVPPDALQRATVARPHQPRDAALAQGVGRVRVQHARAQQAARLPQRRVGRREGAGVDPYPSPAAQACPNDSCECSQLSRTAYLNSRVAGSWITSAPSPNVRSEGVRTCYQTPPLRLIPRPSSAAAAAAPLPSTPLRCAARGADHSDEFRRRFKMNAPSKHGESA